MNKGKNSDNHQVVFQMSYSHGFLREHYQYEGYAENEQIVENYK